MWRVLVMLSCLGGIAHADGMHAVAHRFAQIVKRDKMWVGSTLHDTHRKLQGYEELLGMRYDVKPYQAKVSDTLWRGTRLDAAGLADLKTRGFSAVVGLTAEADLDAHATIPHLRIPIVDSHNPSLGQVKTFFDFVKANQEKGSVYVHCEAGRGRTGVMVAAYRMKFEGWNSAQAIVEARKFGMRSRTQILFIRELGKVIDTL